LYNRDFTKQILEQIEPRLKLIDALSLTITGRVLDAFRRHRVSESHFAGTTGYGYDDRGREVLDCVFADVFGAESALVRTQFVNGTHAIATALYAVLRPGDTLLAATGKPYDTLMTVIGVTGNGSGSLRQCRVNYAETQLLPDGTPDISGISEAVRETRARAVLIQRSRGYHKRPALSPIQMEHIYNAIHKANPDAVIITDNCYGEFTSEIEPTAYGADICAGSLIKNPGGGIAPCGGYITGRREVVEAAAERITVPGQGREVGATLGVNRQLFQGLYIAPHTTAQAMKTAVFASALFEKAGYETFPKWDEPRYDIITSIDLGSPELLKRFCAGIQRGSPVDSFVTPEPWAMPGYDSDIIMAAGTFVSGASIELSADAPLREPYTVYIQGGITFESGIAGIIEAASALHEA